MSLSEQSQHLLEVGRVVGLFGVKAWIKINSYTDPLENILDYQPWLMVMNRGVKRSVFYAHSEVHAKGIVVQCVDYEDMDAARSLVGARIYVSREQLPKLSDGQFYWTDLEGLDVKTCSGVLLGKVAYLFATQANDVLVVRGDKERFIPYISGEVVKHVDLSTRVMQVDWDPEF